jgi:hypothetical protein
MQDGLASEYLNATNVSGSSIQAASVSGTTTNATTLVATVASGATIRQTLGTLESVAIGSPATYGFVVAAGSVDLSAGSVAWCVFGRAFSAAPYVAVTYSNHDTPAATAGSRINTGSFLAQGVTASKTIHWIAVGAPA